MDGAGAPERDPQHAVVVDGHAVRPDLRIVKSRKRRRPLSAPSPTSEVEDVDDEDGRCRRGRADRGLVEGRSVGDREPSTTRVTLSPSTRYSAAFPAACRRPSCRPRRGPALSTLTSFARFSGWSRSIGTRRSNVPGAADRAGQPVGCRHDGSPAALRTTPPGCADDAPGACPRRFAGRSSAPALVVMSTHHSRAGRPRPTRPLRVLGRDATDLDGAVTRVRHAIRRW